MSEWSQNFRTIAISACVAGTLCGCGQPAAEVEAEGAQVDNLRVKGEDGKADASIDAVFLDVEFDGELFTDSSYRPEATIEKQLLYTIGQLNGDRSGSRLDQLQLDNVEVSEADGGFVVRYHAKLPVAWGEDGVPETYTFQLPHDASSAGLNAFTAAHSADCVDWGAHDVTSGSMWYYYRPAASRCDLDDNLVLEVEATATVSDVNTTGKFPEYHKIWEDGVFEAVVVVGKDKVGATTTSDAGIRSYNTFVSHSLDLFREYEYTTSPTEVTEAPGVETPEVMFEFDLDPERRVRIVALLVDDVKSGGTAFDARYRELSRTADFIVYNGHSGLGSNIRALARKGDWMTGQYSIVFMNGCDTYAYVDSALVDAHAEVNDDDPTGTKYVDIVTNALPAPISWETKNTMAFITALLDYEQPRTYEQIFAEVNRTQVALVSGEQDNVFVPGYGEGGTDVDTSWERLSEEGVVERGEQARFSTPTLPAGHYVVELSGDGGDADLYVRVNDAPTTDRFDCRPYRAGSNEVCMVELPSPASLEIMVDGWAEASSFQLVARRDDR